MDILTFITELRSSDGYIEHIYSQGGCYRFHLLLSKMYKGCVPYISHKNDHIITRYRGKYYDIFGEIIPKGYRELTQMDIPIVSKWSFQKNYLLQIDECPHCEEPIVF